VAATIFAFAFHKVMNRSHSAMDRKHALKTSVLGAERINVFLSFIVPQQSEYYGITDVIEECSPVWDVQ